MAQFELIMPKMGESIMEATILRWVKKVGDLVEMEENLVEIATDKVDSEVPSPVSGKLVEIRFHENDTVEVGKVIAIIETEMEVPAAVSAASEEEAPAPEQLTELLEPLGLQQEALVPPPAESQTLSGRFYSPLVRNIAQQENISIQELESLPGTGSQGRVTKKDVLHFLASRKSSPAGFSNSPQEAAPAKAASSINGQTEIIEMDRMRRLIADHMVMSKHTAPHVTSFVEVDVTEMVKWRDRIKDKFQQQYGEKITFTPIFIEAVAKAIRDFPLVNVSVDGYTILRKKDINIGMAAALPSGNLIVPVIRNADLLNLAGLTKAVNDLANRARLNQLRPEEVQGGTFTLTNVGGFGNVMGTPIINQPQVAIMAVGAIRKKPAVVETPYGDLIAIRHLMFISLSYDHRVVDGALGGSFLRRVGDYLEAFDPERGI
ncbi:MAG: dihydrolipoamide acetyltransferase family protein [Haliscomenobacter sp.]